MELQWKALLTQVVGFLIVLWLLRKYAWGQLLAFTEKRRETIANEFATIEKSKVDADALRRRYEEELAGIENTRTATSQMITSRTNDPSVQRWRLALMRSASRGSRRARGTGGRCDACRR